MHGYRAGLSALLILLFASRVALNDHTRVCLSAVCKVPSLKAVRDYRELHCNKITTLDTD